MLWGSSALSEFHTSLSKVLTLALCQSKATLPLSAYFQQQSLEFDMRVVFFFNSTMAKFFLLLVRKLQSSLKINGLLTVGYALLKDYQK